ncbi:Uncharacterised protein [Mycobacteroides abscessus subsp. abscessus]|nr:Uncharacterised protein [Mycobacteroides abscessus subsp. abscessus]
MRREHPQRRHVLPEELGLAVAEVAPVDAVARGPLEQRVVDVGDVLHVVDVVPGVEPVPVHQVERQIGGGVTQVRGVVRRNATDVHGGLRAGRDRPDLTVGGVVEPQFGAGLFRPARQVRDAGRQPRSHDIDFSRRQLSGMSPPGFNS